MTADQLNKMQEDSFRRHLDKSFDFYDGELKPKPRITKYILDKTKRRKKNIMPDLMAAQIPVPFTSEKKEEIPVIKKQQVMSNSHFDSKHDKPHVPQPVQDKRPYFRRTAFEPDPPKEKRERPLAVYNNIPSPYGIASDLLAEQLRDGR